MPEKHQLLIIDDSRLSRSILRKSLDPELYHVDEAAHGEEGIRMVKGKSYDGVYVDFEMPGMDGLEVIETIKALDLKRPPSLVLITSHDRDTLYKKAMKRGADAFIHKGQSFEFPTVHLGDLLKNHERDQQLKELNAKLKEEIENHKITELKLLDAKTKAEASAKAKSDFLANMSHEIRTPMNGILGMGQILADTEMSSNQTDCVRIILNSTESLLAVINDILDFSKIEAGMLSIENIPFDLQLCVEEVCDLLISKVSDKGLELINRFAPKTPTNVVGDPGRIRQILTNFIGNAVKFTSDGHVMVSVNCREVNDDEVCIRFEVTDTGIGIPKDKQGLIFEKFSQADTSITRKYGGTGLGLSISQQLTELMGGEIGLSSEEGKGSTFWFELPLKLDQSPSVKVRPALSLNNCRILYVDDMEVNQKVFKEHFESVEMGRIDCVSSAMEAFSAIANSIDEGDPYKIIATDFNMPEIGGDILADEVLKRFPDTDLRLVMLTSSGKRGDAQYFRDKGFSAYLVKPVRRHVLVEVIGMVAGAKKDELSQIFFTRHNVREVEGRELKKSEDAKLDKNILLAEDNVVNQKVATKMLKKLGCHVDIAIHGREALEMIQENQYDLVLMDCQMPEMDGYEATRQIRALPEEIYQNIPILAMTAHSMQGNMEECLEVGMNDHVAKPVKLSRLLAAIKKWTDKKDAPPSSHHEFTPEMVARALDLSPAETKALLKEFHRDLHLLLEQGKTNIRHENLEELCQSITEIVESSAYLGFNFLWTSAKSLETSLKNHMSHGSERDEQHFLDEFSSFNIIANSFFEDNETTFKSLFEVKVDVLDSE